MGAKQSSFKKKVLAASISSCILASAGASAQDAKITEEVLVTGMRASLENAMDIKRDSAGVVDAISAEDIGKMPDTNLAESLQRITGVSINRANGEGQNVTVRGFGPNNNMVTLNGRTMPTAQVDEGQGDAASRAFDFSNLASEAVSGIEVYKTGRASIATGGIGATINIKTGRPLDNPGLNFSVGAKALVDTTNRVGDDVTPELSGIVSWTDDSDRFGVLMSLSHQERHSAVVGSYVSQWRTSAWTGPEDVPNVWMEGGEVGTTFNNAPEEGQLYSLPSDIRYYVTDRERTRTNGQLVLQFAPTDRITTTLDYTYAENDLFAARTEHSLWFANYKNVLTFDDRSVKTPVIYSEARRELTPKDTAISSQELNQTNTLESVGFNVDFQMTDSLSLALDVHDSTAESKPTAPYGGWITTGLGANVVASQTVDFRGDLPIFNFGFDDAYTVEVDGMPVMPLNGNGVFDPQDVGTSISDKTYSDQTTDVTQIRLDGVFELEDGAIYFGVEGRQMKSNSKSSLARDTMGNWGIENPGEVPAEYFTPIDFRNEFSDHSTAGMWEGGTFSTSASQVGRWAAEQYGFPFRYSEAWEINRTIEEDVAALYVQMNHSSELGGMPINIVTGVRYESTDSTSTALTTIPEAVAWEGDNDFNVRVPDEGERQDVTIKNSYNHLLPSLDFDIEFIEGLKGRLSYSKTIARPAFNNLSATTTVDNPSGVTASTADAAQAEAGNPFLVPLESDNFDLSLEWYFDDASYASIGFFEKRVSNFIGTEPVTSNWFGLRDATSGPRAQAAREWLQENDITVNDATLFQAVAAAENMPATTDLATFYNSMSYEQFEAMYDIIPNEDDPLYDWTTQTPVNNRDAKIHGFELAAQHFFGDTGFGLQANYTIVRGDIGFDVNSDPSETQFALVGLSDTANLVAMYENDRIQARITYNWRDKFLDNATYFNNEPSFTEAYSQIDLSASYNVTEELTVSFEGVNVTGENYRTHGRTSVQLWNLDEYGARYNVGVRYTY